MKLALKCFTLLIITSAVELAEYSYQYPEDWKLTSVACGGSQQSPINIPKHVSRLSGFRAHPHFVNYDKVPNKLYLNHTGHTVQLSGEWNKNEVPMIIGDGIFLEGKYIFQQMHFHWGSDDDFGSEHTFNRKSSKVEGHLVHMNSKYDSVAEATQHTDGIVVVAHLYDISGYINDLEHISKALKELAVPKDAQKLHPCSLNRLNVQLSHSYYAYHGSLTTPPCSEAVTWLINAVPLGISRSTLNAFRKIQLSGGDTHNVRPLQPLNNRSIWRFDD